jgi:peptidoglycan/xylan/chitin deacetylase (PgdA/CDA1 family)
MPSEKRYRLINLIKAIMRLKKDIIRQPITRNVGLSEILHEISTSAVSGYWNGFDGVICVTHDVDYAAGYCFTPRLVSINNGYGIRSTINFLTGWDYKVEKEVVLSLAEQGAEIGLHGYTHDIALGSRGRTEVLQNLKKALEDLSYCNIRGFRAPALSMSSAVAAALTELNFLYDSSVAGVDRQSEEIIYCFPYRFPGAAFWEFPLSIQDTYFFRDQRLSEAEAFRRTVSIIERILAMGGIAVLNFHPCIIKEYLQYYRNLLEYIAVRKDAWNPSLGELATYMQSKMELYVQG